MSKFSKVSLFSGLNNLIDVTLDPRHAALCGYTDADLDTVFAPELPGLDRDAIRDWYDGYRWVGAETVYNPFDLLLLFDRREFGAYWFETGTPTFLVDTLVSRGVEAFALDGLLGTDELLSSFDVDDVAPEAAVVPDRLPDDSEGGTDRRHAVLPAGISEPRGPAESEPELLRHLVRGASRGAEPGPRLLALLRANDFAGLEKLFRASSPVSPTSGMRATTSRATKATTRASSTPASRRWVWTCGWRTAPAGGASTWPWRSTTRCILLEFKVVSAPPRA